MDGEGRSLPGAEVPTPVTSERVAAGMRRLGYHYFVDVAGDVGGMWLGRLYHVFLLGPAQQYLQIRGRWNRRIAIERLPEVFTECDRWNRDLVWPKTYVRVLDDGFIHVMAEITTPFAAGATDGQIDRCIEDGVLAGGRVFDALDARYPDPAEAPP